MTLSHATFGARGNCGPTFVSLLSRLGWETVNTTTGAFVLISRFTIVFGTASDAKLVPDLTLIAGSSTRRDRGRSRDSPEVIGYRRAPRHPVKAG